MCMRMYTQSGYSNRAALVRQDWLTPPTGRTRPICLYPQTAIYNGSGSIDSAGSFHCGGDLERRDIVCADILARYKHEVHGRLDFEGSGLRPEDCFVHDRVSDRDGDDDDDGGHGR